MKTRKLISLILAAAMLLACMTAGALADVLTIADPAVESATRDVMNVGIQQEISDINPWVNVNSGAGQLVMLTYQALCIKESGGEPENVMAKTRTQVDATTWDVELYDYITDSQGNNITANDVKFSVEQAQSKVLQAAMVVDSIEVTGDYTFTVHFRENLGLGEADTFFVQTNIVSQAAFEASADKMVTTPVGTGRYTCTTMQPGYLISYELRDSYWQTDESLSPRRTDANVKTINFYTIKEPAQRLNSLQRGEIDMGQVNVDDVETVEAMDGYHVGDLLTNITYVMSFNCSDNSVCKNENVRKAIAYALENESIAALFLDSKCMPVADVSNGNFSDYYAEYYEAEAAENIYAYDLEKSAQYLQAAGYAPGQLTVKLLMPSGADYEALGIIVTSLLEEAGISVQFEQYMTNVISQYYEKSDAWDIYLTTQGSPNGFTVGTYDMVFNPSRFSHGANVMFLTEENEPELYSLFYAATSIEGHTEENVKALHDYVADHCYAMGIMQRSTQWGMTDKMTGVVLSENRVICVQASSYEE